MKALVLSSGGLDSTVCLAQTINKYGFENVASLSIYYGQKHDKELQCARNVAEYYKVAHYELDLSNIFNMGNCALLKSSSHQIEKGTYAEQINKSGVVNTYVSFRNGVILSAAASLAYSIFEGKDCVVVIGVHQDDVADNAYADCSKEFIKQIKKSIEIGTYNKVSVQAPFVNFSKRKIVTQGLALEVPFDLTWSCYEGGEKACGKCATCLDRLKAFKENKAKDPIEYEGGKNE